MGKHNPNPCVLECGTCGRCIEYQKWYDETGYIEMTQVNHYDLLSEEDGDSKAQKKERKRYRRAARRRKTEWLDD
jgi:hypothetical protein